MWKTFQQKGICVNVIPNFLTWPLLFDNAIYWINLCFGGDRTIFC